jgi:hypothetical protein
VFNVSPTVLNVSPLSAAVLIVTPAVLAAALTSSIEMPDAVACLRIVRI